MKNLFKFGRIAKTISVVVACLAATVATTQAQTFTNLMNFELSNGSGPRPSPTQGLDGNFYGTTAYGGSVGGGTFFSITATGTLKTLYNFCGQICGDGSLTFARPALGRDGNFYGTTYSGGVNGQGSVYKVTRTGKLTTLYSFCAQPNCADGASPFGGLIQGTDGNFYGTTERSGDQTCEAPYGCGTVFKMTPQGVLTTMHVFEYYDGAYPQAALVQGSDGNFYGGTVEGGAYGNYGTIFKISAAGVLTTLHSFDLVDGAYVYAPLVQGRDGNFYGTVTGGAGGGTVFRITAAGAVTPIYIFCEATGCLDGNDPLGGVIQATDGNFYGTTYAGGNNFCADLNDGCGTLFRLTPGGQFTTLHNFAFGDGWGTQGGLFQATDGNFYGAATFGGDASCDSPYGCGTMFSLNVGLAPFVQMLPGYGKVGSAMKILGTNLTGTTGVTFNGVAATYTVVSGTEIVATVPVGAKSGKVAVTTPNGVLMSNSSFRVR